MVGFHSCAGAMVIISSKVDDYRAPLFNPVTLAYALDAAVTFLLEEHKVIK